MKINKQELLDNVEKLMEKLGKDEVFAKVLAEKQTSAEVAEFLLANGIRISEEAIDAVIDMLKKEASGSAKVELSEDALDNVAAGMAVRSPSLAKLVNWEGMY
ncbi:MAG: hypothetical protein ACI3U2_01555 [Anaerovibrio sp.]